MNERFAGDEARWAAWMARAQQGERAVYAELLRELGRAIEAYVRVRFGAFETLEDCVQECLMAVHAARHTYDPARPFRPWLFTIVRHRTIDVLRQQATWRAERWQEGEEEAVEAGSEHVQRRLDGVKLLARLSPDHREMIALAKFGGYTTAEAAASLGISESAAKARLHRALEALRTILTREELPT